eukprot:7479488-Pyramimonas_sp.AAC.1
MPPALARLARDAPVRSHGRLVGGDGLLCPPRLAKRLPLPSVPVGAQLDARRITRSDGFQSDPGRWRGLDRTPTRPYAD